MRTVQFWATDTTKKKVKNVSFGRIRGFHKIELIKPSSNDPNAPNSIKI